MKKPKNNINKVKSKITTKQQWKLLATTAIAWIGLWYLFHNWKKESSNLDTNQTVTEIIKDSIEQKKLFTMYPWGTITQLIRDSIILDNKSHKTNPELQWKLAKQVLEDNNIENANTIQPGDIITIDLDKLNKIASQYIEPKQIKPDIDSKKEEIIKHTQKLQYSEIKTANDLSNSNDYLVKRLKNDSEIAEKIEKYLSKWYSILIPQEIETKDTPSLTVDEITKPDKILSQRLKNKKIVIDPGHGSLDIGAVGFAQYGDSINKQMVAVYESPVVMDISYRIAKLIRSHGWEIVLTHYYNKRPIMDQKDLPPTSRVFVDGHENFQDIWTTSDHNTEWDLFAAWKTWLQKRADIANNTNNVNLFVSFHADSYTDNRKILSIKHQPGTTKAKEVAESIMNNGFEYTYNGKKCIDVKHTVDEQDIYVLKKTNNVSILVEFGNLYNENQAYYLRNQEKRQKLAEKFVAWLLGTL